MTYFAYERVSTIGQDLENQRQALEQYAHARGITIKRFYGDVSGYPYARRPQWQEMVKELKSGKAKGLLVFRVDRLGRNAKEASFFIEDLRNRGIELVSIHECFDSSTAIGRAMLEIILVLNQLEREQISEATRQRLAAARASGKRLGRPALSRHKRRRIEELAGQGLSPWQIHKATRYSVASCYKYGLRKTPNATTGVNAEQNHASSESVGLRRLTADRDPCNSP